MCISKTVKTFSIATLAASSFLFWLSRQPGIFWKSGFIRELCGAGSDSFEGFEGLTPSEKQPRLFEKPDSDKDMRNVGVGVSECA